LTTRRRALTGWRALSLILACCPSAFGMETVYQSPAEFLGQFLPGCHPQALWLSRELQAQAEHLVDHPYPGIRVRYCRLGQRTAWVLDEIGKTEPITSGIIIHRGSVERVRVLVFRESRGAEVHRSAFVEQYHDAALLDGGGLDRPIDGITGATLSVAALSRQVKLALLFDGAVQGQADDR
jgi:hypothetical protein